MSRVGGLALLTLLGSSCVEAAGACEDGPAEIEIGRGEGELVPLTGGDELELEHGPQGGVHTTMALRLLGLGTDPVVELFGEVDGQRLAQELVSRGGSCDDDGLTFTAVRLIWEAPPDQLHRAEAEIRARATASDGRTTEDVVLVVLIDSMAN